MNIKHGVHEICLFVTIFLSISYDSMTPSCEKLNKKFEKSLIQDVQKELIKFKRNMQELACDFNSDQLHEIFNSVFFQDKTIHDEWMSSVESLKFTLETLHTLLHSYNVQSKMVTVCSDLQSFEKFQQKHPILFRMYQDLEKLYQRLDYVVDIEPRLVDPTKHVACSDIGSKIFLPRKSCAQEILHEIFKQRRELERLNFLVAYMYIDGTIKTKKTKVDKQVKS